MCGGVLRAFCRVVERFGGVGKSGIVVAGRGKLDGAFAVGGGCAPYGEAYGYDGFEFGHGIIPWVGVHDGLGYLFGELHGFCFIVGALLEYEKVAQPGAEAPGCHFFDAGGVEAKLVLAGGLCNGPVVEFAAEDTVRG